MRRAALLVASIVFAPGCDEKRATAALTPPLAAISAAERPVAPPPPSAPPRASSGLEDRVPARRPLEITEAQRNNGFSECMLPDPGLGYYAPLVQMPLGWAAIPERGGHTEDLGFDVIVHFHGFQSVRKTLATRARGVVLAGFDLGTISGEYGERVSPLLFETILKNVTRALRAHTKDDRAHVRHVALSAWSAGFAGVSRVLRGGDRGIDAVVLLDGLHTGYLTPRHDDPASLDVAALEHFFAYAEKAKRGEKIFFFTHSEVGADRYASTTKTAAALLRRLDLVPTRGPATDDPFGLVDYVEVEGLHVRGYAGAGEKAHCDQLRFVGDAVRDVIEPAWGTPLAER